MVGATIYIDTQIKAYNMDYYFGKDDGALVQLESVLVFSVLFYSLISRKRRLLLALLGFISGLFASIISYLPLGTGIPFVISASLLIVIVFYLLEPIVVKTALNKAD